MFKSKIKILQLTVTLAACAFLLVPTILSILAGVTVNYFKGISSGLTLKWVYKVWELYADSIFLSMWLATCCLIVTLIIGLPAAYGLARHPGRLSRLLEVYFSTSCCARFSTRACIITIVWVYERVSFVLDIYISRSCSLHSSFYG